MIGLGLGLVRQAVRNASGQAWTPAQLFSNGEQGVWYEPKPQYLFQDDAGTVPVTADGDPVGLMLDLSKGLKLGPELVTNGTFDTDLSGWGNKDEHWQWVSGYAEKPLTEDYLPLYQNPGWSSGTRYKIRFDVASVSGDLRVSITSANLKSPYAKKIITQPGTYEIAANVRDGLDVLNFSRKYGSSASATIGNISIRELPGNHATQSTSAARPIYRTDGVLHWLEQDSVDDRLIFQIYDDPASAVVDDLFVGMSGVQAVNLQGSANGSFVFWGSMAPNSFGFLLQSDRIRTWSDSTSPGSGSDSAFSVSESGAYTLSLQVANGSIIDRRSTLAGDTFYTNESVEAIRQTSSTYPWSIGYYSGYGNPNMTGLVMVVDQVSAGNRAQVQQYLQGRTL